MIATDPYGKFLPGPDRGLPQLVTKHGLVEGDRAADGGKVTRCRPTSCTSTPPS